MSDFPSFAKIPRLHKDVVLTEKIDGTNGLVSIRHRGPSETVLAPGEVGIISVNGSGEAESFVVRAGSRNRWLTTAADNFGFARWVEDHAGELVKLGPGNHYGEWFGRGIQRGYGLTERRFALFNVARWYSVRFTDPDFYRQDFPKACQAPACCDVVPVLLTCSGEQLNEAVETVRDLMIADGLGSAVVEYDNPEGVVIYHSAAGQMFKVIFEGEQPKSAKAAA